MSVAGMDNGIKLQIIFHHHSMWLSATGTMTRLMNASMVSNFTHNFMVCEGMCFVCVMGSQFPWFKVRQRINSWMIKMKQNLDSKSKKQKASWARAKLIYCSSLYYTVILLQKYRVKSKQYALFVKAEEIISNIQVYFAGLFVLAGKAKLWNLTKTWM